MIEKQIKGERQVIDGSTPVASNPEKSAPNSRHSQEVFLDQAVRLRKFGSDISTNRKHLSLQTRP
jgi:hypothetical protein